MASADDFRETIFKQYGFTQAAQNYIRSNSLIRVDQSGSGGGGFLPGANGARDVVSLNSFQQEAAVHELSHVWYNRLRQDDPHTVWYLVETVVKIADMPLIPEYKDIINFLHVYVYGDSSFNGMFCNNGDCADPHHLTDQDIDTSKNPTHAKVIDWEIYAGLASFTMGKIFNGPRKMPPELSNIFDMQFTGVVTGPLYYNNFTPEPEPVPEPVPVIPEPLPVFPPEIPVNPIPVNPIPIIPITPPIIPPSIISVEPNNTNILLIGGIIGFGLLYYILNSNSSKSQEIIRI